MIIQTNELKKSINQKAPQITVSKQLLSNGLGSENSPWVDVGFGGFADMIKTGMLFIGSMFSTSWNKAYVLKKLQYHYALIKKDQNSMTFGIKN